MTNPNLNLSTRYRAAALMLVFILLGTGLIFFTYVNALQNFMLPHYRPGEAFVLAGSGVAGVALGGALLAAALALMIGLLRPNFGRQEIIRLMGAWALTNAVCMALALGLALLLGRSPRGGISRGVSVLVLVMPLVFIAVGAAIAMHTLRRCDPPLVLRRKAWQVGCSWVGLMVAVPVVCFSLISFLAPGDIGLGLVVYWAMAAPFVVILTAYLCHWVLRRSIQAAAN